MNQDHRETTIRAWKDRELRASLGSAVAPHPAGETTLDDELLELAAGADFTITMWVAWSYGCCVPVSPITSRETCSIIE